MNFSEKLYELRLKSGLTQKELSEQIGVSQASINYWEKGQRTPSIDAAKKIADFFSINISELVDTMIEPTNDYKTHMKNFKKYGYTKVSLPIPRDDFYHQSLEVQQGYVAALLNFFEPETVFAYYDVPFDDKAITYFSKIFSDDIDSEYINKIKEYAKFLRSQKAEYRKDPPED